MKAGWLIITAYQSRMHQLYALQARRMPTSKLTLMPVVLNAVRSSIGSASNEISSSQAKCGTPYCQPRMHQVPVQTVVCISTMQL